MFLCQWIMVLLFVCVWVCVMLIHCKKAVNQTLADVFFCWLCWSYRFIHVFANQLRQYIVVCMFITGETRQNVWSIGVTHSYKLPPPSSFFFIVQCFEAMRTRDTVYLSFGLDHIVRTISTVEQITSCTNKFESSTLSRRCINILIITHIHS